MKKWGSLQQAFPRPQLAEPHFSPAPLPLPRLRLLHRLPFRECMHAHHMKFKTCSVPVLGCQHDPVMSLLIFATVAILEWAFFSFIACEQALYWQIKQQERLQSKWKGEGGGGGRGRGRGRGRGKETYTPVWSLSQAVICCYLILSMSLFQGHGIYPKRASLGLQKKHCNGNLSKCSQVQVLGAQQP